MIFKVGMRVKLRTGFAAARYVIVNPEMTKQKVLLVPDDSYNQVTGFYDTLGAVSANKTDVIVILTGDPINEQLNELTQI